MIAVMVGGPLHGQRKSFTEPLPVQWMVPRPVEFGPFELDDNPTYTMPDPYRYELRWYRGRRPWEHQEERLPAYLCTNTDQAERPPMPRDEDDGFYVSAAEHIWHLYRESLLPTCVVPECAEKGRVVFVAAESGRLAGRDWERGDKIGVCLAHAHDIYMAAGAYGMEKLAEWIRPDATWDPLDAYDGGQDVLYGAEVLERTARMLYVALPHRPEVS